MVAQLIQTFPLVSREYKDKEGRPQIFKVKGFIFDDGRNTFYAEAQQEWAQFYEDNAISVGSSVIVHPICRCREWEDNNKQKRYSNEVTISNIKKL